MDEDYSALRGFEEVMIMGPSETGFSAKTTSYVPGGAKSKMLNRCFTAKMLIYSISIYISNL